MEQIFTVESPATWSALLDLLMRLRDGGKKWTIIIKPYRKRRSNDANAYWWSCVVGPLADHLGYDSKEEMHRVLCGEYFGWKKQEFRGQIHMVPNRTTTSPDTLSVMDMQELIEFGKRLAVEYSVILPDEVHQ